MPEQSSANTYRPATVFVVLAFALSWVLAGTYFALGGEWNTTPAVAIAVVYMFMPALSAVVVQRFMKHEPVLRTLGVTFRLNRWIFVAWLIWPVLAVCAMGVALLLPGVSFTPGMEGMIDRAGTMMSPDQLKDLGAQSDPLPLHPFWIALIASLVGGATVNALAGFGEELGWRGFLLRELAHLGFWRSSLIIGVVWGLWHAPLILAGHNYPEHPFAGVFMMVLLTVLLSAPFAFARLKSRSVFGAAIAHGTFNGAGGLAVMLLAGGNDLLVGVTGMAGIVTLAALNIILALHVARNGVDMLGAT